MVEQFDSIKVKLEGIGEFGEAASAYQGFRVSVFGGIPGETVEARVIRISHTGLDAVVEKVIEASPDRRSAVCEKFGECSGCQWQHIRYSRQLELKQELVRRALKSQGLDSAGVQPVQASPDEFGYRNHARLTVRRRINQIGFINRVSRRFVPIDQCPIMAEGINSLMAALFGRCAETTQFSIRYGINTDDYLIQPRMLNPEITVTTGQPHYFEVMSGRKFRVSSPAFFQVNTPQAERLADLIRTRLQLSGSETIIDAYAGVGTFAALLAPYAKKVIAIEESGAAVKDARVNVRDIPNIELLEAKTESVLPHLGRLADAIIIDPSRSGCHPAVLKSLSFYPPKRLVYVSCNPEALACDLRVLTRGPYAVNDISPVDLFPQTYHVETLATLILDENKEKNFHARQKLVLASASPRRSEVLTAMGLVFEVAASEIAEALTEGLSPEEQAKAHAVNKAAAVAERYGAGTIIAADTIVVSGDEILGKPGSAEEATAMLRKLRGKTHRVVSGVAVTDAANGEDIAGFSTTLVTMRHYTDEEIEHYVKTGSPLDKAGAYGIQDKAFNPVSHIKGCYLNVVGLPVCLMQGLLLKLGVHPTVSTNWRPDGNCQDCRKWQCA
ncbi:Maf family nucleotide pyrophosphatase [Dehalogenimonas sp. 4OHTPN]|uniref:dTTP/UTP pyrophosphatase n=1 Tax=Dehalogenimonas sp. 4OHTPN TaxID=3166643 RepID=A0AAU8G899_9CHLR